ncbi:unnamed protein product [Clonostachys byssicola]|uniref:Secreted protein n=1 Tax=Clonostachys byssicola TaxID=160290 RepID=A0A9N9XV17_9HYPO|nr:unnamed protein product [Clonostachys byssicola]
MVAIQNISLVLFGLVGLSSANGLGPFRQCLTTAACGVSHVCNFETLTCIINPKVSKRDLLVDLHDRTVFGHDHAKRNIPGKRSDYWGRRNREL